MQKWEILKKEPVLITEWVSVFRETVRTSRGHIIDDYYTAQKRDVAMIAAFTTDGHLVMIREYKHGCGKALWQLPAGGIDDGGSAQETAARELAEEAGISAHSYQLLGSWYVSPTWLTTQVFVFVAEGCVVSGRQNLEHTEEIEVCTVTLREATEMVAKNEILDPISGLAILLIAQGRTTKVTEHNT